MKIRQIRELKGLSQENLALELGISQPSYARLEKDDSRISITRLISIANILKTPASEFINEKMDQLNTKENIKNLDGHNADKDHIQTLKDEIVFLRKLLEHTNNFQQDRLSVK